MRELMKKVGSLVLGVGALALVLANAAMTHGCARSTTAQVTPQAGPPSAASEPPSANPTATAAGGGANPNCTPPSYMYATKAPIWTMLPPECRGGTPTPTPAPQQAPSPGANAEQQAP
jgi:hypothetical protein